MTAATRLPLTTRERDAVVAWCAGAGVTVGALLAEVEWLAGELPDARYVLNLSTDRYRFLRGFCAALLRGQVTLMPPNQQSLTLRQTAERYPGCYLLGGPQDIDGLPRFVPPDTPPELPPVRDTPQVGGDELAAIVFTSGSTGESTPNRKTWNALYAGTASNIQLMLARHEFGGPAPLSIAATVPAQHMWGFETSVLMPLFYNAAISARTPFFPQEIADLLAGLPRPRALVSSPVHLKALHDAGVAPPPIDVIFTATAPLPPALADELAHRFGAQVIDVFGCSESGIIAARERGADLWTLADAFTLDSQPDGTLIKAAHLDAPVPLPDRVELCDGRHFRWLGRSQDLVNIAGKRGSLADLNQRLTRIPGVVDGVIFLPSESATRLAALVVSETLEASDILRALKDAIDPVFLPRPLYMVNKLPRSESSKLPRQALLDLFAKLRDERRRRDD
jgi:acyl-coenzyme A synthetase/AMP-(fatty) acid ligase